MKGVRNVVHATNQAKSWKDTAHGKAMESLKPGTRKEAKLKAKLNPG